jgi:hypothetical protein
LIKNYIEIIKIIIKMSEDAPKEERPGRGPKPPLHRRMYRKAKFVAKMALNFAVFHQLIAMSYNNLFGENSCD